MNGHYHQKLPDLFVIHCLLCGCVPFSNLNPDTAIENSIFRSIQGQTSPRLEYERSASISRSFRLVSGVRLVSDFAFRLVN